MTINVAVMKFHISSHSLSPQGQNYGSTTVKLEILWTPDRKEWMDVVMSYEKSTNEELKEIDPDVFNGKQMTKTICGWSFLRESDIGLVNMSEVQCLELCWFSIHFPLFRNIKEKWDHDRDFIIIISHHFTVLFWKVEWSSLFIFQ